MINDRVLQYSLQSGLTLSQLKAGDYVSESTDRLAQWAADHGVSGVTQDDAGYHYAFRAIKSAPYLYHTMGDTSVLGLPLLAIVGPRKMSDYAQQVLEKLFDSLRHYRIATVSGLAPGVDTLCHDLSIQHGIPTIGVIGSGLGHYLKSSKRSKLTTIVDHGGLIVSEFRLGQQAAPWTFPQRNRIIAGLGQCLFLPEASEGSGSLITVEDALSMSKPIYGAPQSIFHPQSQGLLRYMQSGQVRPVIDLEQWVHDEFGQYRQDRETTIVRPDLTDSQQQLVTHLASAAGGVSLDELTALGRDAGTLMSELTMLEMQGVVREEGARWLVC